MRYSFPLSILFVLTLQFLKVLHLLGLKKLIYATKVLSHPLMAELINLSYKSVEEVAVVAHYD